MSKRKTAPFLFFALSLLLAGPVQAQSFGSGNFGGGGGGGSYGSVQTATGTYMGTYAGHGNGLSCSDKTANAREASDLIASINVNLSTLETKISTRVEDWGHRTARALMTSSASFDFAMVRATDELKKTQEAALKLEQDQLINQKTLEATQALKPSDPELTIANGLVYYRPDLPIAFRQSEMERYINELNHVPLDNKFRNATTGEPLAGYVDTSVDVIESESQEFRNFVRLFCDVRSLGGKVASTKFEQQNKTGAISVYWCGQGRGLAGPNVAIDPATGKYKVLEGAPLDSYVSTQYKAEITAAKAGQSKIKLVNGPKNVDKLYFEPGALDVTDYDVYAKAEQEFARFVVGRADNITNVADFTGTDAAAGQRRFMEQQARTARLALARYPFADMFAQQVPSMPAGSADWAATLIEANLGDCKAPAKEYKQLCNLAQQVRAKGQISEALFYDVLFSRQFQGMAFSKKLLSMSEGQLKRLQNNILGLQLALNFKRNRMHEQNLALLAGLYAHQNQ